MQLAEIASVVYGTKISTNDLYGDWDSQNRVADNSDASTLWSLVGNDKCLWASETDTNRNAYMRGFSFNISGYGSANGQRNKSTSNGLFAICVK